MSLKYRDIIICGEELDDYYNGDEESDDSVAEGLGLKIDDDGNWLP